MLPIYGKEKDKWHKPPQPPEPEESFYQRYLREKETKKLINQSVNKDKCCFIENDVEIDEDEQDYILWMIYGLEDRRKDFNNLFDIIITEASTKYKEVWEAIVECKYIFIKTAFIGDSAYLLEAVCEAALRKKIKDKVIINFRYSSDRLYASQRGLRMLQILQVRNNIKYISQDTEEFYEISKKLFL